MKLSTVTFYKNTPFTKLNETVIFKSETERNSFLSNFFMKTTKPYYNIVRDRLTLQVSLSFTEASQINFIRVNGALDDGKTDYYFQVGNVKYDNDDTSILEIVPDVLFTYCAIGDIVPNNARAVMVEREHLTKEHVNERKVKLGTNDDVLELNSVTIRKKDFHSLSENHVVIFSSSISLSDKFGTEKSAEFKTDKGALYDNIITPLGLYAIQKDKWVEFQTYMKDFSWVAQGITNVAIVPLEMVDFATDFTPIKLNNGAKDLGVRRANNGAHSSNFYPEDLKTNIDDWRKIFGADPSIYDRAIFRKNYFNIRAGLNTGQTIDIDPAYLPDKGLDLICQQILGVNNEFKMYPSEYRSSYKLPSNAPKGLDSGLQYENSITFSDFSTIPTVLDPKNLSLGMSSHERAFADSQTPRGQVKTILDEAGKVANGDVNGALGGLQGTAVAGLSLYRGTLTGALSQDYKYYEGQKAKFADMALQAPTISEGRAGQNFGIANGTFGVQVEYQVISDTDYTALKRYHNKMGFKVNEIKALDSFFTYKNANYAKFTGNWSIPGVPSEFMEAIRALYSEGVLHYHYEYASSFPDQKPNNYLLEENEPV